YGRGVVRADLSHGDLLHAPSARERGPPSRAEVAHPRDFAVGRDEPAPPAVLHQRDGRGAERAAAPPGHNQEIGGGGAPAQPQQRADDPVDGAPPEAETIAGGAHRYGRMRW